MLVVDGSVPRKYSQFYYRAIEINNSSSFFRFFPIFIKKNIYKINLSKEGTLTCRLIRRGLADHFQVAVHVSELVHLLRQRARGFKGKPETCNSKTKYQLIHRNKLIKKKKKKKIIKSIGMLISTLRIFIRIFTYFVQHDMNLQECFNRMHCISFILY